MKRILLPRALVDQARAAGTPATGTKRPLSPSSRHAAIILQATDGAEILLSRAQATQSLMLSGLLDMVDGEQEAICFSSWPEAIGANGAVLRLIAQQLLAQTTHDEPPGAGASLSRPDDAAAQHSEICDAKNGVADEDVELQSSPNTTCQQAAMKLQRKQQRKVLEKLAVDTTADDFSVLTRLPISEVLGFVRVTSFLDIPRLFEEGTAVLARKLFTGSEEEVRERLGHAAPQVTQGGDDDVRCYDGVSEALFHPVAPGEEMAASDGEANLVTRYGEIPFVSHVLSHLRADDLARLKNVSEECRREARRVMGDPSSPWQAKFRFNTWRCR